MKRLFPLFSLLSLAFFLILLTSCKSHSSGERPTVLRYAFSPQAEQLQGGSIRVDLLRSYLEKQLHMPVEIIRVEGYAPTIEAMRAEKVDIATFGSLSYIIAAQKAGAEAIVSRGNPDGSLGGYLSTIAVPKDSPLHSMSDVKAHAKDLVFAFSDPASTSGNLYPRVYLLSLGIDPEKDFKQVVFAGTHLAAVMTIKAGKVDVGAYQQNTADRLIAANKMKANDVRVLWHSELIPNGATAVRKSLPEDLKKKIQNAFLAIPTNDPELWANIVSTYRSSPKGMKYITVNDATYDGLRKYAAKVKDFSFVEK